MRASKQFQNSIIFCITHILSAFGYEFIFFMMTIYVYNINKSPLNVGIFTALSFLPKLFSPFYGVLVDQYSRKHVFGIATGIVGCLILLMGITHHLYWIYALWFVTSIFLMLIANVRTALMTEILSADNFLWGNSAALISLNLAKLLAPVSAGCLMAVSAKSAFIYYTSGVYFFCMAFTRFIQEEERTPHLLEKTRDVFLRVREGVLYILKHQTLKTLVTLGFFWRLFLGLQVSLFVIYIKSYLTQSDAHYGLFMTMIGVGSLMGSVIGPWIAKIIPRHQLVFWGLFCHYLSFACLGCIHNYWAATIIIFLSFALFYTVLVGLHSLRDQSIGINFRGRVYGSVTAITTPPTIMSMLAGGFLAEIYGVENVLFGAGIFAALSLIIILRCYQAHLSNSADTVKAAYPLHAE